MNVCVVCGGDGVLLSAGHWYCINHVDNAFIDTAMMVARLLGHDDQEAKANAEDWLKKL